MTAQPPPLDRDREDVEAFLAGRRSLLTMAFLGFGAFTFLAAAFAFAAAMQGYAWSCGLPNAAGATIEFTLISLTSLYGMWVFGQLIRCGMLLDESGRTFPAAMDRHRVFWTHAPILSLLCFGLFVAMAAHDYKAGRTQSR
jgi:hypothetical protein